MTSAARALRIEMVLPSLPVGGMEMLVIRLARALSSRGHHVGITCTELRGDAADHAEEAGLRVAVVPAPGLRTNLRAPALEAHFRAAAPDVVHSHSGVWLKAARAAHRAGIPRIIHTVHGLLDHEPWHGVLLKRLAARYTEATVAVSDPLRDYLARRCGIAGDRLTTIINGIDTVRFAPVPAGSPAWRERRERIVGDWWRFPLVAHVARLVPVKNQLLLLEGFRRTLAEVPHARLLIAGDGPLRPMLEAHAQESGIAAHVRFLGAMDDVADWLPAMDAFVLSSDAEGTSISILEAMASGIPVIGTAVGGTPRLLANGAAGLLIAPGDPEALRDALTQLLCDTALRMRIGTAGRLRAGQDFDEQQMVVRYEHLYRGTFNPGASMACGLQQCVA